MKRKELITSKEYWLLQIQNGMFEKLIEYLRVNKTSGAKFAKENNLSRVQITQVLNGSFDGSVGKFVEISLALDVVPRIIFTPIEEILKLDKENKL